MVTYLGLLVQLCCGERGTLQTNITGVCGKCLQCLDHTGFAPAHSTCAFPVALPGNCPKQALGFMHFPGLRCSGSCSGVLHKGTDLVEPAFCALPWSEQLRQPGAWQAQATSASYYLIISLVPAARIPGLQQAHPSLVCCVSLPGS